MIPNSLTATSRQRLAEAGDPFGLGAVESAGSNRSGARRRALMAGVPGALARDRPQMLDVIGTAGTLFGCALRCFSVGSVGKSREGQSLHARLSLNARTARPQR